MNTTPLLLMRIREIIMDTFLVLLSFITAYLLRINISAYADTSTGFSWQGSSTDFPFDTYCTLAIYVTPFVVAMLAWSGLYSLREKTSGELFRMISFSALSGGMLFVLMFFFQREFFFSRLIVVFVFLFQTGFVFGAHLLRSHLRSQKHRRQEGVIPTLVIGNGRPARRIITRLQKTGSRFQPMAILAPYGGGTKEIHGIPVVGKLDSLEHVVQKHSIGAIFQTEANEQVMNMLLFSEGKFLEFYMSPTLFGASGSTLFTNTISGVPLIGNTISPLFGWGQVAKRLTDIILSSVGIVLCSPLFLMKKISSSPMATGKGKDEFLKYEFSSHERSRWKHIPELLNVFRGEMSLVGPRPRTESERSALAPHERRRLILRPGIFGLWQLEFLKNNNRDTTDTTLDVEYILSWTYMKDIRILGQSLVRLLLVR